MCGGWDGSLTDTPGSGEVSGEEPGVGEGVSASSGGGGQSSLGGTELGAATVTASDTTTLTITEAGQTTGAGTDVGIAPPNAGDENVGSSGGSYKFVSTTSGELVRVPENWEGRIADNGRGLVFQEPGANGNANMIRIMDPTTLYPQGYVVYTNEFGQPLDVYGQPTGPEYTHIPLDYKGPIPGWP